MKKKIVAVLLMAVMALTMAVGASAAAFDVQSDVITPVTTAINETVTVQNVIAVVVAGLGIALAFVLMWFGYRKIKNMSMSAMKKGKLGG